jgi:hypothetical protein
MSLRTLVLLIKIYSTYISAQKDANTLSICLIVFTFSPIDQTRAGTILCFLRTTVLGGHSRKLLSEPNDLVDAQLSIQYLFSADLPLKADYTDTSCSVLEDVCRAGEQTCTFVHVFVPFPCSASTRIVLEFWQALYY